MPSDLFGRQNPKSAGVCLFYLPKIALQTWKPLQYASPIQFGKDPSQQKK
jgi:hypothetical protein